MVFVNFRFQCRPMQCFGQFFISKTPKPALVERTYVCSIFLGQECLKPSFSEHNATASWNIHENRTKCQKLGKKHFCYILFYKRGFRNFKGFWPQIQFSFKLALQVKHWTLICLDLFNSWLMVKWSFILMGWFYHALT